MCFDTATQQSSYSGTGVKSWRIKISVLYVVTYCTITLENTLLYVMLVCTIKLVIVLYRTFVFMIFLPDNVTLGIIDDKRKVSTRNNNVVMFVLLNSDVLRCYIRLRRIILIILQLNALLILSKYINC